MLNFLFFILYLIAFGFMIPSVDTELKFLYYTVSEFSAYHYLNLAIVLGFIAGITHLFDGLWALCQYHGQNSRPFFSEEDAHWRHSGCTFLCSFTGLAKFVEFLIATTCHLLLIFGAE